MDLLDGDRLSRHHHPSRDLGRTRISAGGHALAMNADLVAWHGRRLVHEVHAGVGGARGEAG